MSDLDLPPPPRRKPRDAEEAPPERVNTRAGEVKAERRRRGTNDVTASFKLSMRFTPDPNYEYRWINEGVDGQRLYDKTQNDDWDVVTKDGEQSDGPGSAVRRAVGQTVAGPVYAYLCRKPKSLCEADKRESQRRNDKMMDYIRNGVPPTAPGRALSSKDNVYVPEEGIRLSEPRRTES